MPRKRTGYDAACYYDGKLLGRCTKADSDAYTLLMNACGGEAARVLREYAYFSPELKAILEKAALMQAEGHVPPQLDPLRQHAEARPVRRARDVADRVFQPVFRHRLFQREARLQRAGLLRRPGTQA